MTSGKNTTLNQIKTNLWVDVAIFIAMLLALAPRLTDIAIHEWLSLALAGTVVVHLLLHWQWIMAVTRRFLGRVNWQARLNYVLNVALFICFVIVTFTGIMISQEALPLLGINLQPDRAWRGLHTLSADLIPLILGLHVALHWKWIFGVTRRFLINPIAGLFHKPNLAQKPAQAIAGSKAKQ